MTMKRSCLAIAPAAVALISLGVLGASQMKPIQADQDASFTGEAADAGGTAGANAGLCQLIDTRSWGRVGDIHAFSIRTDTWNVGDEDLRWEEFTPVHPVMAQNLYRYRDGRFEQIGLSWIKHGFCALQQSGCGNCAVQPGCLDFLGAGCRDPYSANLNGNQVRLGPRSEVNASTGEFPYPFTLGWQQRGDEIYKRIQVQDDDLNPALNADARYFIEGQIMHVQEGTSALRHNNATHEEVAPMPVGDTYELGPGFNTVNQLPAIYAWQAIDPEVVIEVVDAPGAPGPDGRYHVGYRVYDNGDGTWRYEYAVHNLNSHRSARAFQIRKSPRASVISTFHRDVKYHSGEVYTNEDWTTDVRRTKVSWSGMHFEDNPDANALRWGTMFNFALVSDTPPSMGEATITLFRPGGQRHVRIPVLTPGDLSRRSP